jgi:hypothetical protein
MATSSLLDMAASLPSSAMISHLLFRTTKVTFTPGTNFARKSKPHRTTPSSKQLAAISSRMSNSLATQALKCQQQVQAAHSLQLCQLQEEESFRQHAFKEEQSIRNHQVEEANSLHHLQLQDALTTLRATQQLLESLCTSHFGSIPTTTHLWTLPHAIPHTYTPAEPFPSITAFHSVVTTNPFDSIAQPPSPHTSGPSQKANPNPLSSLDSSLKSSQHTQNNSSISVLSQPSSSISSHNTAPSNLHPQDKSISNHQVDNAGPISDIISMPVENPPCSNFNHPASH